MKFIRYGILLLATMFTGCAALQQNDSYNDIPPQVVTWAETNAMHVGTPNGSGSGFWVDNETFVTACHVVGQEYLSWRINPKTLEGESYVEFEVQPEAQVSNSDLSVSLNLAVKSCDRDTDIAVLKRQWLVSDSKFTALPSFYAHPNPELGEAVYGAGYGLSERLHITIGHWQNETRYSRGDRSRPTYIITAPTIFGDSGSAALRLKDGRVEIVGIRQAVRNTPAGVIPHLVFVSDAMDIHTQVELNK